MSVSSQTIINTSYFGLWLIMKITDLLVENKKQVDEAPMGFLKTMGNKVAGAFGSGQAKGRLETGNIANQLKKEFDVYLGKTGDQPTGDMVVAFLKSKGYPTQGAERALKAQPAPGILSKIGGAVKDVAGAAAQGAKDQMAKDAEPAQPAAQPAQELAQQAQQPQQDKAAIAARVKANVGKTAAATKGSNFGQPAEKPAQPAPSSISSFVKQQLGDNPITMKPAPQKAQPAAAPAPQQAAPAVPARAQGGGKVAGQLSQTPGAIKKRQARAVKKRTGHPADDNPNIQLGTESYVPEGSEFFRQQLNFFRILKEALSSKQLDAVFLAAAQDKARQDASGGAKQQAAGAAQPAAGQTAQSGQAKTAPQDQPGAKLTPPAGTPGTTVPGEKDQGIMAHIQGAVDGFKGVDYEKGGDPRAKGPGAQLKDTSGKIPANIVKQINQLTFKQRQELRKELDKA